MANLPKSEIMKGILYAIAALGLVAVLATFPGIAIIIREFYPPLRKYKVNQIKRSLTYLHQKKLIGLEKDGDKTVVKLTEKGKEKIIKFKLEDLQIKPQRVWDKKFRLIIFDIPETFKYARKVFADKLKELGFVAMQKSAWVYPYPCADEFEFLISVYEIRPFVKLVTISAGELELHWQKKFNLL